MSYFEQELCRIASACDRIINPVFAGRACYGDLGGDNRVKLQFATMGVMDHYEAIKATVLSRSDGEVDTLVFHFEDVWGRKPVSNPNFKDGVKPYIWKNNNKYEWYAYYPTDADIRKLAAAVGAYLGVFIDRSRIAEKEKEQISEEGSVIKTIRKAKRNPTQRKNSSTHKKPGSER